MFWYLFAPFKSSGLDYWQAFVNPNAKGQYEYGRIEVRAGRLSFLFVSAVQCSAYVSPQSLLVCYVSPHSPCLISREKRSASGLAQCCFIYL